MAIFGQYQGGDPFQVGPNMQGVIAGQKAIHESMYGGVEKIIQAQQEMDVLRSTTGSILSQFPVGQDGKPLPAAPKYVHDLYKSVEKEGGIQGLSKSSLIAALKGYETGFQVEAQQMQIRQAQQAETLRGYQIKQAEREEEEFRKVALAHKLAMESAGTPSGRIETATAPTFAYSMPADMGNEIYKYQTGQRSTDPRQVQAKPQVAQPALAQPTAKTTPKKPAEKAKTLEQKVNSETAERDALEERLSRSGMAEAIKGLENQLAEAMQGLAEARSSTKRQRQWGNEEGEPYVDVPKTLDEIAKSKLQEQALIPQVDSLKKQIAEMKKKAEEPMKLQGTTEPAKPVGATPAPVALESEVKPKNENEKIASEFLRNATPSQYNSKIKTLEGEIETLEILVSRQKDEPTLMNEFEEYVTDENRVPDTQYPLDVNGREYISKGLKEILLLKKKKNELNELKFAKNKFETFSSIPNVISPYTAPIGPAKQPPEDEINPAFLPTAVPESVATKATSKPLSKTKPKTTAQAQPQPQIVNYRPELKSDDEKITEEYGQLTSRLKAMNGIPLNWSEDTYRQMRGYAPKIKVIPQGGFALIGIGDKWQVMKTGGENQMSPSELASHEKHLMLKDAIRTDKMTTKKWTFAGDIRTTETDTAGKVKKSVLDTTRALDALDKLIEVGQDTGFWDSITPTERAGIIEGVTNSVQAAGRTEIAGSGAFSEQDAKKLESIVPSLASISGAVFKETTLAKLKTYRERMAQQVKDIGRTWGFQVSEATDTGLTPEQQALMRDTYREAVKQGYSHEDAKQIALESLSQ